MDLCYKLGLCAGRKHREITSEQVKLYLQQNPQFLTDFVDRNIDLDTIEGWVLDRTKAGKHRTSSLSRWKFGLHSNKQIMLQEMAISLHKEKPEEGVMWEMAICICSAINADQFILFLRHGEELRLFQDNQNPKSKKKEKVVSFNIDDSLIMASSVAKERKPLRLTMKEAESRFPQGIGPFISDSNSNSNSNSNGNGGIAHILCYPIIKSDGNLFGVLQLLRKNPTLPFFREDEEIVNSYLIWGGISIHYVEINQQMNKQKIQNEFLLNVVKSIFHDMVSMDLVIRKIMNFAQKLVNADRASLFLVDMKSKEVFARLFDMGNGNSDINTTNGPVKEIRFPIGTGIAGQVAANGVVLNIQNAYGDERFNRKIDQMTGYTTKTILCMPILIRGNIIGVVQMVNKKSGYFNQDDEEAFETFAVYCGLALYHAKLYDKIRRSEQKYKVALEVLSYHNSCTEDEVDRIKETGMVPKQIIGLENFYFITTSIDDFQKVQYAIFMFVDLFGLSRFDLDSIYRFCLTVRKNYRRVPYHNWTHGFTVAHSMYCILKKSTVFRPMECLALFIGALCHDLDHRGKNNKFMLETASPLASIYTTSTLEHHHFNQTVTILQQEGHNIFAKLNSDEYKQVLGNIKHCILATDLSTFFPTKAKVQTLLGENNFAWGLSEHRLLIQAISMTAADLCASAKPWASQVETVKVIFEEFYQQGDLEKAAGLNPIPMMDRNMSENQAESQVGFISGICIPCYNILSSLIPESQPLLEGCQRNLDQWKKLDEEVKKSKVKEPLELAKKSP